MSRRRPQKPEAPRSRAGHLSAGEDAEALALAFLRRRGLRLLERNYRCRAGELDLVMRDGATVVIVEIRYRRRAYPVGPSESVTRSKQLRIVRATRHYLSTRASLSDRALRFDVVALSGPLERVTLQWLRGAFDCTAIGGA